MSGPQQGWYDDPALAGQLRWWDGSAWTARTRPYPTRAARLAELPVAELPVAESLLTYSGPTGERLLPPAPDDQRVEITASMRRRAIAVVGGVVVLAVAFAIFVPRGGNVFELSRGTCVQRPATAATGAVAGLPVTDCGAPHDAEVFAVYDLPDERHPGVQVLGDRATSGCHDRFEDEVGVPQPLLDLDVVALWPSVASFEGGDREVLCLLTPAAGGARLVGSRLDTEVTLTLTLGGCLTSATTAPSVVPCTKPHQAEVFAFIPMPEGDHPGTTQLRERGERSCRGQFADYVGVDWQDSDLEVQVLTPGLGRWTSGSRTVVCLLQDPAASSMVGSLRRGPA